MDFITGLPKLNGKEVVFVMVDRLTKYNHFIALVHLYMAMIVAQVFVNHIYKLHGFVNNIVSDCDPILISSFWQELFKQLGVSLCNSSAYHPQTDG